VDNRARLIGRKEKAMGVEIELKLALPKQSLQEVQQVALLREVATSATTEQLDTVYFHTPKSKLRKNGISLRVRSNGTRRVLGVKSENGAGSDILTRGEWEAETEGPMPDLRAARRSPLQPLLTKKLWRELKPIFETSVERKSFPLRVNDSSVELALNHGTIASSSQSEEICELELELKEGIGPNFSAWHGNSRKLRPCG
jgi:inorganic triphosphatase YgiF